MLKDKRKSKEIRAIDLFKLVDTAVQFKKSHKGDVVKIALYTPPNSDKLISGTQTVNVLNANFGFDWDQGKLILQPEVKLCKYSDSSEKKLSVVKEMLEMKCSPEDILKYLKLPT